MQKGLERCARLSGPSFEQNLPRAAQGNRADEGKEVL